MKHKSEVYSHFLVFQRLVENLFDTKIKIFQSDGGREFDNSQFLTHFSKCGISFQKSCPDTQQQNGVVGRKHRHLIELARTMLIASHISARFWVDVVYTAVYIINRLPTPVLDHATPFEKLFRKQPDYSFMRVFGCKCFPNFTAKPGNKLTARSIRCVFLGYASGYKGYRCLDPVSGRVYISRNVQFHETVFPYHQLVSQATTESPVTDHSLLTAP